MVCITNDNEIRKWCCQNNSLDTGCILRELIYIQYKKTSLIDIFWHDTFFQIFTGSFIFIFSSQYFFQSKRNHCENIYLALVFSVNVCHISCIVLIEVLWFITLRSIIDYSYEYYVVWIFLPKHIHLTRPIIFSLHCTFIARFHDSYLLF